MQLYAQQCTCIARVCTVCACMQLGTNYTRFGHKLYVSLGKGWKAARAPTPTLPGKRPKSRPPCSFLDRHSNHFSLAVRGPPTPHPLSFFPSTAASAGGGNHGARRRRPTPTPPPSSAHGGFSWNRVVRRPLLGARLCWAAATRGAS